jgi:hypothetical protein
MYSSTSLTLAIYLLELVIFVRETEFIYYSLLINIIKTFFENGWESSLKSYKHADIEPSRGRTVTKIFLLVVPLLVLLYDAIIYVVSGNDATISKILLDTHETCAPICFVLVFGNGVLVGHFWLHQHVVIEDKQEKGTG